MTKIIIPNINIKPFASESVGTERTVFGDDTQSDLLVDNLNSDWFRGWGIVGVNGLPTKQDFNGGMYTSSALTTSYFQMGVPEWRSNQEYFVGSIANVAGELYKAVQINTGVLPTSDDGSNWLQVTGGGFAIVDLDTAIPVIGDFLPFQDVSDSDEPKKATIQSVAGVISKNYMLIAEEYASGTSVNGSNGWNTRALNTVKENNIAGASLSSNQITLPVGSYIFEGACVAYYQATDVQPRIRNITDSTTPAKGLVVAAALLSGGATANAQTGTSVSLHSQVVTIATTKTFEFQMYIRSGGSSGSMGSPALSGEGELYAQLKITKVL